MLFPHLPMLQSSRLKVYTDTNRILRASDIPPHNDHQLTIVSGPDGFIEYVAGSKPISGEQGELRGLLAGRSYKKESVIKL